MNGRIITYQCAVCGGVFHEDPADVPKDRLCPTCKPLFEPIVVHRAMSDQELDGYRMRMSATALTEPEARRIADGISDYYVVEITTTFRFVPDPS